MSAVRGTLQEFRTPGPTISRFMNSTARIVGVMGPQGGGKTTAIVCKILAKAAMQPRSPVDGRAYYRCVVLMDTYRNLWSKVIPDWLEWVPKDGPGRQWNGGRDNPAEHSFMLKSRDSIGEKIIHAEIWFRAVGDQTPQEAAKGIHATDAWMPESTSATNDMRMALFGRIGRYPHQRHGGAPHRQMFCDWNAGDPYNWTTEYFVNSRPDNVDFFCQPGGREAAAENLSNLEPGYYDEQIEANKDDQDWIRRMVDNKIGFMRDGKPVFGEFDATVHVATGVISPWRGRSLIIAADAGLTPAILIGQKNEYDEYRLLNEIVADGKMGAGEMATALNRLLASERYKGVVPVPTRGWADPAAGNATESSQENAAGELQSWMDIMTEKTGIQWKPSRCNNSLVIRHESVTQALKRRVQQRPAVQVDGVHCPNLVAALARDYRYTKVKVANQKGEEFKEKPDKGKASHVGNACEYFFANAGEQDLLTGKAERRAKNEALRRAAHRAPKKRADPFKSYGL